MITYAIGLGVIWIAGYVLGFFHGVRYQRQMDQADRRWFGWMHSNSEPWPMPTADSESTWPDPDGYWLWEDWDRR